MTSKVGNKRFNTSWQRVAPWYNRITKEGQGHYYHKAIIIPNVLRLLNLDKNSKVLDLGCGNGVLANSLPKYIKYLGIDKSESLVRTAISVYKNTDFKFVVGDVAKPLTIPVDFTHTAIILALQNIKNPDAAIANAARHMGSGGKLLIVLNHPVFRIPRQSSWGFDEKRKIQFRRIDMYMSPMVIPIRMNPSNKNSEETLSYHHSLNDYSRYLKSSGFVIESIEEWTSDKESVGRSGKMENRARAEIPLFMAILAIKT